ncbi:MAG: hypothetical protein COB24_09245 [Hyphomicrobiales bacterium]|nr:MAG: hypothetical protein COB24_09245 [Hyphomicrobiales bacterium]
MSTGNKNPPKTPHFDWHKITLSKDTVITNNYKNSQNIRWFFTANLGESFKFNIEFMAWIKANSGKTLGDACLQYQTMKKA